jgi:hypothetical protein
MASPRHGGIWPFQEYFLTESAAGAPFGAGDIYHFWGREYEIRYISHI